LPNKSTTDTFYEAIPHVKEIEKSYDLLSICLVLSSGGFASLGKKYFKT